MQTDFKLLWDRCLGIIRDIVPQQPYETWFRPIVPLAYDEKDRNGRSEKELTVQVPSQFFYEFLEAHYMNVLTVTLNRVFGQGIQLKYRIMVDKSAGGVGTVDYPAEKLSPVVKPTVAKNAMQTPSPFSTVMPQDVDPHLNPRYNFENYFEGSSNKLVRAAGEAVAQEPGSTTFNPLFIYGPSGVGKTHLCYAIGTRIRELHPELRVLYVSSHLFRMQFTDAVRKNTTNDFLHFYQNIDVLILDDIQEMIGMDRTQNTFFHIFNHLHQLGKQLILTSDKPPVDLQGMEERLITRLKWGLTAELSRPDLALRKKILKNKITHDGIVIPDEVFNFIADNVTDNVRDLEGILVSLQANAVINNREIDLSLAKRVISQSVRLAKKQLSVQSIQETVCRFFNLEQSMLQTNSRKREIVQARQVAMYLSKKYTDCSLSNIGKIVGRRDHATVLHACKTIKDQIETSKDFAASVEAIEVLLKN